MGHSASSVHKKTRCPRCLRPFKTPGAVLKHQKANPSDCTEQSRYPSYLMDDDIDEPTWERIDDQINRQGFGRLPKGTQDEIDVWVLEHLNTAAQTAPVEERKWELRKWNMTWRILFPHETEPPSPCMSLDFSYDNMLTGRREFMMKVLRRSSPIKHFWSTPSKK